MNKRENDMIRLTPHALIHSVMALQLVLAQELGKVSSHEDLLVLPVSRELSLNVIFEHLLQLRPRVHCQHSPRLAKVEQRLARAHQLAKTSKAGLRLLAQHQSLQILVMPPSG